jgi:hypothetical protein
VTAVQLGDVLGAADGQAAVLDLSGALTVGGDKCGGDNAVLGGDLIDDRPSSAIVRGRSTSTL